VLSEEVYAPLQMRIVFILHCSFDIAQARKWNKLFALANRFCY